MLAQDYDNYEVVVVNDGSTDKTREILDSIADNKLIVFHQPHMGLVPALNFGLNQCKGEYIARMDADDWCPRERIKLQAYVLKTTPDIGVVSSLVSYAGNRSQNLGYALHVDWLNQHTQHEQIWKKRFEDAPVANPSCMVRASLFDRFGAYRVGEFPEDYEFWLRLLHEGVKFTKVKTQLLHWSDYPSRITRNLPQYSIDNFHKIKAYYLARWLDDNYKIPPEIYVFGNGRQVKRKVKHLNNNQLSVHRFIDVKKPPYQNPYVIHYLDMPTPNGHRLILSYIGDRQGKLQVIKFLTQKGYTEGLNFFLMN